MRGDKREGLKKQKNTMKKRRTLPMRTAIFLFCIVSVLFALLLQTFLFQRSLRAQIRTESITENETALGKLQTDITSMLHTLRTEMLTIYNENDLIEALRAVAKGEDASLKEYYWRTWYVARKRFTGEEQLLAMYLYDGADQLVSTYRYNCTAFPQDIYKADYDMNIEAVTAYLEEDSTDLLITGYYNPDEDKDIVRFVLKLHTYDEEHLELGYLICDFDASVFTSIMEKYVDVTHICLWLQPQGDQTVALTGANTEEKCRLQEEIAALVAASLEDLELKTEYEQYYLIQVGQSKYNLQAFALVSQSLMTSTQQALLRTLGVIMVMMIAAVIILAAFLTRWLTRPLEEMQAGIVRIKNGETELRLQTRGWSEEVEVLGTEFNEMLDRVQLMAQEEYKYRLLVEQTEYKLLQAQINPHFLYNTLNTMSGIAIAQNCPQVSGICHSLSAIFRYSLNMADDLSTMKLEMAHVRNYLYVMDVRNGSTIAYEYQLDGETMNCCLPRISLQPIVENAITHGLRNVRRKDKRLIIRSERTKDNLIVSIIDNGTGMDAESMNEELKRNDPKRVEKGVSIGILNVNARLKKLFGAEYGLHVESAKGEGTTVTLTVPVILSEEEEKA